MTSDTEQVLHGLMVQVLGGAQDRYQDLLKRIAILIRAYLRRKLTRAEEVEELVQEVLLAVHLKRHTYDVNQPVTTWLHAIARYKLIDHWRRQGRRQTVGEDDAFLENVEGPSSVRAYEVQRDVSVILEQLPQKQRDIVQMIKLEGLSVSEVAMKMNMSESAVKVTTHRAIKAIGKWLGVHA